MLTLFLDHLPALANQMYIRKSIEHNVSILSAPVAPTLGGALVYDAILNACVLRSPKIFFLIPELTMLDCSASSLRS